MELSSSNMYGTSTNDCLQRQIQYQNTRIVCTKKYFFFCSVAKIDPVHLKFFEWVPSLPDNVVINGFLPINFFSEFFCKKYNLESCREETGTSETNAKIGLCCFVIQELPKCLQGKKKRSEYVAGRKVHFCCNILLFTTTHNWCEPIFKKDRSNCRMSRQRRLRKCVSSRIRIRRLFF